MSAEAFRLIRQIIPPDRPDRHNDIFIVGDAHQRIYAHQVVLGQCGIDIRGRGRKLRLNYRTTEETRGWSVAILEGRTIDDLDGGADDNRSYRSLTHGDPLKSAPGRPSSKKSRRSTRRSWIWSPMKTIAAMPAS